MEPRTQDFATQGSKRATAENDPGLAERQFDDTGTDRPDMSSEPVNIGGGKAGANADPFAAQRTSDNDPFANQREDETLPDLSTSPSADPNTMPRDRRMSKEWGTYPSPHLPRAEGKNQRAEPLQMLPKFLPRGSRSAKGVSTPLRALEMLTRAGVKTGTRASTRSSRRRCVLPRPQPLALFELSVTIVLGLVMKLASVVNRK